MENILQITLLYISLITLFSIGYYLGIKVGKEIQRKDFINVLKEIKEDMENKENDKNSKRS